MLRSEADVVKALCRGTYTLDEIYSTARLGADVARAGGHEPSTPNHPTDARWKHRVRGALSAAQTAGRAQRVGHAQWAINGPDVESSSRLLLIVSGGTVRDFELRLQSAVDLLGEVGNDRPADLILTDPPYALERGTRKSSAERIYTRDSGSVMPGYVDVPAEDYETFMREWVAAAAGALRPGGQLAIITGPDMADIAGISTRRAGLTRIHTIAARRAFAKTTSRRCSPSHWVVTTAASGSYERADRVFNPPPTMTARSGSLYPLDFWPDVGRVQHRGDELRYDNELPQQFTNTLVAAHSNPRHLVCDPFLGGGAVARSCLRLDRDFIGGDLNINALRLTGARILTEDLWPTEQQMQLAIA